MTYEQAEDVQRTFCKELDQQYVAADPDLKAGFALETRGRIPDIFTGRDQAAVGKVLTQAGELSRKTGREEGGVYMNNKGRLIARLNDRGGQNVAGLGMAIVPK
jgi:hypothetical protein